MVFETGDVPLSRWEVRRKGMMKASCGQINRLDLRVYVISLRCLL